MSPHAFKKIWPLFVLAIALTGCGGSGSSKKGTATPCTGKITGDATGSFTSCGFDTEPFALKSSSEDVSSFLFIPAGMTTNFSAMTVSFVLFGTPTARSYGFSDLKNVEITVQNADTTSPYVLRRQTPPQSTDQGDVTLSLASVRYDATSLAYYLHGTIDATLPVQDLLNPSTKSVKMHVDF